MKRIFILCCICILLLTGCWDQKIYERTGFILQMGIETGKDKKILVVYALPVIGIEKTNLPELNIEEINVLRQGREEARKSSPKIIEAGKLQQILFSDELAEKGIHEMLEIFHRDPVDAILPYVVIVEGSPRSLIEMSAAYKNKPLPSMYVNQLLTNNKNISNINDATIAYFDTCYYAKGLDPFCPMIKSGPKDVKISGSALFSGDKMVGKISTHQTTLLIALTNKLKSATYIFPSPNSVEIQDPLKEGMIVMIKKSKSKIEVKMQGKQPVVNVMLSLKVNLDEYQWDNVSMEKYKKNMKNLCRISLIKIFYVY
ncbi:MAG: Ger(x)C family spore germination protein [Bacillota bacterium]|nr:Ger(x)C family spore germination protein [Bacillota bacterium]